MEQVSEITELPKHCLGMDPFVVNILVNDRNVKFPLDTAADVTVVTESSLHTLVIELKQFSRHLVRASGN